MAARILDGESLAAQIRESLARRVEELVAAGGERARPGLGTVLVGDDGPSARYVAMKHVDCAQVGIESVHAHLPASTTQEELGRTIARFNADPKVDAYLVQVPLPDGLDEEKALMAVDP
ncbi:MAG: tetrahydrofolate dehydrogenase/cyclohydrolase catalytic domain-containing protein, partial [Acidimicrobiales bacterium]